MNKDKEKQILSELKKSNTISRIALGGAFIFIGIQMWPATYNYGMKLGISAIFIIFGFLLVFLKRGTSDESMYNKVSRWVFITIGTIGIIAAIILYIVSWLNSINP